ncbi:hypothetical protein HY772_03065 [Candidatus Woesearchaeota archaeon]|nr:hypothetical protein [Candidatus Woesearchaeota archaeon]
MTIKIVHRENQEYDFHVLEEKKAACDGCHSFKAFGKNCWYYWEFKKECSQKIE